MDAVKRLLQSPDFLTAKDVRPFIQSFNQNMQWRDYGKKIDFHFDLFPKLCKDNDGEYVKYVEKFDLGDDIETNTECKNDSNEGITENAKKSLKKDYYTRQ